jgi:hypothetical protein
MSTLRKWCEAAGSGQREILWNSDRLGMKEFVTANADIDQWLKRQAGFQSRRIAELDDGSIVDMLLWDTAANGEDAASRIMVETANSSVHAAIDQRSVVWRIAEVRHHIDS